MRFEALPWVQQACGLKPRYAQQLIKAADWVNAQHAAHLDAVPDATTLFLLSADTTPEEVREGSWSAAPHVTLKSAQAQAAKAQPLAEHRRPTAEEQKAKPSERRNTSYGETQSYLLRRIARDQPELLDQIGPDKPHRSARAAAIAAGIIKPVPTIRLVDDLAKVAAALRKHLDPEQRRTLAETLLGD